MSMNIDLQFWMEYNTIIRQICHETLLFKNTNVICLYGYCRSKFSNIAIDGTTVANLACPFYFGSN